ncbi:TnsA endonuclease N-terminal domain-containing protein [Caenimonas soli]|uniref:TnsA endonuclease N-terminal domain-containing protein n=1 Tax=Caenimonas soli TaxID=2735555 RepID=UPI001553810E|nr:TnsA endonuclease N-terminal domain-containing protein [Caenimonas soli]NPC56899.1 hypothetical protein [Caenimonas soli]
MLPHVDDNRTQYRLNLSYHAGEITEYCEPAAMECYRGTIQIAKDLCIAHPLVRAKGEKSAPWRMTTDCVVTLRQPGHSRVLLALSFKSDPLRLISSRDRKKLAIEREYWMCQGHEWLLITPEVYDSAVAEALERSYGWAMGPIASSDYCEEAAHVVKASRYVTLQQAYNLVSASLQCDLSQAQKVFWQAVWGGLLPIDLRHTLWVTNLLRHISLDEFQDANPVSARRSAWIT